LALRNYDDWIENRDFQGWMPATMAYAYALNLWFANAKDTAVLWLEAGDLVINVHGKRCQDLSSPGAKSGGWATVLKPLNDHRSTRPPEELKRAAQFAYRLETLTKSRAKDETLCRSGAAHMAKLIARHGDKAKEAPAQADTVGRTFVVPDDSSIPTELVSDFEWLRRRDQVLAAYCQKHAIECRPPAR
jgi:hypothetical protein